MTQNSILINFDVDFIIEIVNQDVLKNLEYFIPYKTSQEKFLIYPWFGGKSRFFGQRLRD